MDGQTQLDLLLELRSLEETLKRKKGKEKKKIEGQIDGLCSRIDAWVLKHYRRYDAPFGEFRDRTCCACGMIYPKTHIHCRPSSGDIRLCEGCGRILLMVEEGSETGSSETSSRKSRKKTAKATPKKTSARRAKKR
ncbi:MAG: hypothetical protein GTO51_00475 [Candidatus Latescibacteria bacterium]|nr:hypothetical protein [Candidatus Latescibacterota bacterium]NIM64457.1 hypothetical protein [Candidatus Latescibacterota bacterium]NIO00610.1 hypothetical protein [Candidatus Latescibacterota bacterium]NIO27011.1 hypothetical protein [Candidatus Latescibacterota bacterium]NIO56088.1 hypothetical protein [Candidatus Latescibacterota bacterium]